MQATLNKQIVSEEIDDVLAKVLGKFLVQGSPTKHGGLRFLDIESAKTFGFERTREVDKGNLLIISAPAVADSEARLTEKMRKGPHADRLRSVTVRESRDSGKKRKMFVEVEYFIPTAELVNDKAVTKYAETHKVSGSEAVKRILREEIIPLGKAVMDHLIVVIREEEP